MLSVICGQWIRALWSIPERGIPFYCPAFLLLSHVPGLKTTSLTPETQRERERERERERDGREQKGGDKETDKKID